MLYLNKLLSKIKENPTLFKSPQIILSLGITSTQIKDLKKFAIENQFIVQKGQEYFLTLKAEEYLVKNPLVSWTNSEFKNRPEINVEALKEDKSPATLTKAIRAYAKHLLEKQELKEFSLEHALLIDVENCKKLYSKIESDILTGKRILLNNIYEKYFTQGLTKSLVAVIVLKVLSENLERIAIYEKSQFQLKFDCLMFDRMIACPQNFEIQKTEILDEYILKDVSKIILNKKSNNILEITKGLYETFRSFDKYTMNTQNLSKKTLRFRNAVVNAKDPMSLFERDIPKVLAGKLLYECDREFLNCLKNTLDELKNCTKNLVNDLQKFLFNSFKTQAKEDLSERFLAVKEYIASKELKVLSNSVVEVEVSDELWVNRIATYINGHRVPKDWSDEDYSDFKVKTRELALKFCSLEATIGTSESIITENYHSVLNSVFSLSKPEQIILLRTLANA